jgi:hypothetical protein
MWAYHLRPAGDSGSNPWRTSPSVGESHPTPSQIGWEPSPRHHSILPPYALWLIFPYRPYIATREHGVWIGNPPGKSEIFRRVQAVSSLRVWECVPEARANVLTPGTGGPPRPGQCRGRDDLLVLSVYTRCQKFFPPPLTPNPLPPLEGEGIRGKNFWQTL